MFAYSKKNREIPHQCLVCYKSIQEGEMVVRVGESFRYRHEACVPKNSTVSKVPLTAEQRIVKQQLENRRFDRGRVIKDSRTLS